MQQQPSIITKHPVGYLFIGGVGFALISLIAAGIWSMWRSGVLTEPTYWFAGFFAIVILLITIIQLWVYSLSYIEFTEQGIHVVNWRTIFVKQDVTTEWARVQDVTVGTTSVWSLMFNYGSLTVQTAGTAQDLTMTMVPDAEYWQAIFQAYADDATAPV